MKEFKKNLFTIFILQMLIPCGFSQAYAADTAKVETSTNGDANVVEVLLNQAKFWHDKYQSDKAINSLNRVLLNDPNNEIALYYMSLWYGEQHKDRDAKIYRDKLAKHYPNSSYLQQLDNLQSMSDLSAEQLNHARTLNKSGNIPGALAEYKKLFNGAVPPKSIVSEYYLTMAGDNIYYDNAVKGIIEYIRTNPNDITAQVTYGKILTYRKNTIRKGIEILDYYSNRSRDADESLKQALLWLEPTLDDEKYYKSYAAKHGSNTDVSKHYDSYIIGKISKDAYEKKEDDKLGAIAEFEKIIERNPNNQEALEAIGYTYLEIANYGKAFEYLEKAAALGGSKGAKLTHDANLAKANYYVSINNFSKAKEIVNTTLASQPDDMDAMLLMADINIKLRNNSQAEDNLVNILSRDPSNEAANEMLYYLYKDLNRLDKSEALLSTMPGELQDRIRKESADKVYVDPIPGIRSQAKLHAESGDYASAFKILEQGIKAHPDASWLRYDLGLLLRKKDLISEAYAQVHYLNRQNATDDDLFAAATLLNDFKDYKGALDTINRVKDPTEEMRFIKQEITINRDLNMVDMYLSTSNLHAAQNTLDSLSAKISLLTVPQMGYVAKFYLQCGQPNRALEIAKLAADRPIKPGSSVDDYANLIHVFNETGNVDMANLFKQNPSLVANSSKSLLEDMDMGDAIRKADHLRMLNRSADAYDVLYPLIEAHPENNGLRMAMARIYYDNGMNNEAYTLYDQVLKDDPNSQDALEGAINAAYDNEDYEIATHLAERLQSTKNPHTLTLMARIDEKNKNYNEALSKLYRARSLIDNRYTVFPEAHQPISMSTKVNEPIHQPGNPFSNRNAPLTSANTKVTELPWTKEHTKEQVAMNAKDRKNTINEINYMIRNLLEKTSTTVNVSINARQKNGNDGTSRLDSVEVPITVATPVGNGAKAYLTATPTVMYTGEASGEALERYGSNSVYIQRYGGYIGNNWGETRKSGVAFDVGVFDDNYRVNLGITPVGKEGTNLVGRIFYKYPIAKFSNLTIDLERTGLKDSLLSYFGSKDGNTGTFWGAVTRNGLKVEYVYDDSYLGGRVGASGYIYRGQRVQNNHSFSLNAGIYVHPIKPTFYQDFTIGFDLKYETFLHNQNNFSIGHGGYFSPQKYFAATIPINFRKRGDNLVFNSSLTFGFQNYTQQEERVFPLDDYARLYSQSGLIETVNLSNLKYPSKSKSGFSVNANLSLDYYLFDDLIVGGSLKYDTFGEYKEASEMLYVKSVLGGE